MRRVARRPVTRANRNAAATDAADADAAAPGDMAAPPTSAYRGGVGSPLSQRASNISPSDTRSELGSRLPSPNAANNTPQGLLTAAQTALSRNRTGAAQEALEQAETRVLSRTVDPSLANQPDTQAMVQHIGAARRALGSRDVATARAEIQAALGTPVPPTGPAVTTVTVPGTPMMGQPMMGQPMMGQPMGGPARPY